MAAIIRLKRLRDESVADSLVIACKKQCLPCGDSETIDGESTSLKKTFKFAGTVSEKEASHASKHVREAIRRDKLQKEVKHCSATSSLISHVRKRQKHHTKNNRYKVVSERRALDLDSLDKSTEEPEKSGVDLKSKTGDEDLDDVETKRLFCMYDVIEEEHKEKQSKEEEKISSITCNGVPLIRQKVAAPAPEYVYDIYYLNEQGFDWRMFENILSIEATDEIYCLENWRKSEDEVYEDEDDSNDEDNWRNDYPEEDPHYFENENAEYWYGDDDHCLGLDDEDEVNLRKQVLRAMRVSEAGMFHGEDRSSDEDIDLYDKDASSHVWAPTTSYDDYKHKVMKELQLSDDEETKKKKVPTATLR